MPVALLALAAILFAVMALTAKLASARLPGPEVALVRFVVGLIAVAAAATRIRMRANNWVGLAMRGALGGAAVLLYFLAIAHLDVGIATLLNYTAPVFAAMWAWIFLRERLGPAVLAALALASAGVFLVVYGGAPPGSLGFGPWQLCAAASAVLSGAAIATIREVRRTDGSWEIFASFCVAGTLITAIPASSKWVAPTPREWGLLTVVGVLSVLAQLLMTWALKHVPAAIGGVMLQVTPVTSLALGWIVLDEKIAGLSIVGAALTLSGVTWAAWRYSQSIARR